MLTYPINPVLFKEKQARRLNLIHTCFKEALKNSDYTSATLKCFNVPMAIA